MIRCKHCNKLAEDEHLFVHVKKKDMDKINEMYTLVDFHFVYTYHSNHTPYNEYGKVKVGDIWIH